MPLKKSLKELSTNIYNKYVEIRNNHNQNNETIISDKSIVSSSDFVYLTLLNSCEIHYTSLYKLINVYRNDETFSFSNIIINPYKYVSISDNILNFEKAHEIALKYEIPNSDETYKAWLYDLLIYQHNALYLPKSMVTKKFIHNFDVNLIENLLNECQKFKFNTEYISLPYLYNIEIEMTDIINTINFENDVDIKYIKSHIKEYEKQFEITFTNQQKNAMVMSISNNLSVICGFPGTGKSTITDCICRYYNTQIICLLAPTGMAVNNLKNKCIKNETNIVGTLHKVLYDTFYKIEKHPNVLIIDEFSMVDMLLFYKILKWCKTFKCKLIIIADHQQLAPISAGFPLLIMISCNEIKTKHLSIIKRQNEGYLKNMILKLNKNQMISVNEFDNKSVQFYKFSIENIKKIINRYKLDVYNSKFITPQHKHEEGTINMNSVLQDLYNKSTKHIKHKYIKNNLFKENDLVVRTVNDYKNEALYANGDMGVIHIDDNQKIYISYLSNDLENQYVSVDELYEDFSLGYCLTVHKVQGSQFDIIVLIMADSHEYSWSNNDCKKLMYTAISRAISKCIIIGNPRLFHNAQQVSENSRLSHFLK
jgi:exodeoxyribonuclease V alpha subunit